MRYKVLTYNLGIPHFYAFCDTCNWIFENFDERERGYQEIKKHVSETGHGVQLEKTVATHYRAANRE